MPFDLSRDAMLYGHRAYNCLERPSSAAFASSEGVGSLVGLSRTCLTTLVPLCFFPGLALAVLQSVAI